MEAEENNSLAVTPRNLKPQHGKTTDGQLPMPIKNSRKEVVYGLKRRASKAVTFAGVIPYWRNFYFVLAFLVTIFMVLLSIFFLYFNYNNLPSQIPLMYNQATQLWMPVAKQYLLGIPLSLAVFCALNTYWNSKIFQFDRRLVQMINISVVLANIFLFIGLSQIISLILVY